MKVKVGPIPIGAHSCTRPADRFGPAYPYHLPLGSATGLTYDPAVPGSVLEGEGEVKFIDHFWCGTTGVKSIIHNANVVKLVLEC